MWSVLVREKHARVCRFALAERALDHAGGVRLKWAVAVAVARCHRHVLRLSRDVDAPDVGISIAHQRAVAAVVARYRAELSDRYAGLAQQGGKLCEIRARLPTLLCKPLECSLLAI